MRLFQLTCIFLMALSGCLISFSQAALAQAQQAESWKGTRPTGKFLTDSLKIGYPLQYALTLKHPADMEVIFPDSSFGFAPFEWVEKQYFPTRTDGTGSVDSVVYTLTSFDLAPVQRLSLPIYIITRNDCTTVFAQPDSVFLHSLLAAPADTLLPQSNLDYQPVQPYFNYGSIMLLAAAILMALLVINVVFGKRIRRLYMLYTISREHSHFRHAFDRLTRNLHPENAVNNIENAVILWKKYMESLEDKPFSTYTTKEIIEIIPNQQLAAALQHTDRIIYGQMVSDESVRYTRILAYIAKRSYIEKRAFIEKQKV